jgi:hypothetical protein
VNMSNFVTLQRQVYTCLLLKFLDGRKPIHAKPSVSFLEIVIVKK